MKEPQKPWPPNKWEFEKESEEKVLLSKLYINSDTSEQFEEIWEDNHKEGEKMPEMHDWGYHTQVCTLKDIFDLLPPDVNLKNVVVSVHRDRHITSLTFNVTNHLPVDNDSLKAKYNTALAKYNKLNDKYKKDKAAYDKWKKEKDIKELETKLAGLKKK